MKETEWAILVAEHLHEKFSNVYVSTAEKLTYANEVVEYNDSGNQFNTMEYETDILLYEQVADTWKPRVVIETKVGSITTHDAITYSQKSASHKFVHPYLRYGIFLGNRGHHPLPGRLFRHGAHFDFMLSWQGFSPQKFEFAELIKILGKEIEASRKLEEMIFNSRSKSREKYFSFHKPLLTSLIE